MAEKSVTRRLSPAGMLAAVVCSFLTCLAGPALADAESERAATEIMDGIADQPNLLRLFLQPMPKGADLHNHLAGTPSAEDMLDWAAGQGFCAKGETFEFVPPPCADGDKVAHIAQAEPFRYARLVDYLSTRGWQRGVGADEVSGHTQFFIAFDRFGPVARGNTVASLKVALQTAAGDQVSYLELMHNPQAMMRFVLGAPEAALDEAGFEARYAGELAKLAPAIAQAREEIDADEAALRQDMACDTPSADPACNVKLLYLATSLRALAPSQVFRALLFGFALSAQDPRFVGVNIAQPEDWPVSLRDYDLHMAMYRFFEGKYPGVGRTMHAGELAFGLVPPADMKNHMRKALDAGAQRIGHGTGIAYEDGAAETLRRMARERVAVEINLTSNAVILGVKGADHPLQLYRRFGVPVVLSTDDEGILRTDLTNEYVRAVREQGLRYPDLKAMARASLEYAFLPGASYWSQGRIGTPGSACARSVDAAACAALLASSEKARLQADLEARFDKFERSLDHFTTIEKPGKTG